MTALRTAAQQALEALEFDGFMPEDATHRQYTTKAITALRAALKQEEEASAWLAERKEYWRKEKEKMMKETNDLRSALAQQAEPVEPVQEPVAWMYTGIKQDGTEHGPHLVWKPKYMDAMSASKGAKATPLYTAPPQRKPLTEEEIEHIGMTHQSLRQVVRAVEKAVWEKNHGQA